MDALVDLTGGLAERYDLNRENQGRLFKHLYRASKAGAFITCSRKVSTSKAGVFIPQTLKLGEKSRSLYA